MIDTYSIERGWPAFTADGHRVGDVTEVHPTYILVSRGLVFVSDTYVPLYAIEKAEDGKVRLQITREAMRRMDWKKPPRTPLELVRPGEEETSSLWGGSDDATSDEEPATVWAAPLEEDDQEQTAEGFSSYWDSEAGIVTNQEPEEESYDTLGIVTGSWLEVEGGVRLAFQSVGHGHPVVLLHDWLLGQAYWDSLVLPLAEQGYRVVTLDWRGHGASDRPWDEYWSNTLTHDLRTLTRTLDLEEPTIIGHGLGAAIALQYAATYRQAQPRRLILLAPAAPLFAATEDFPHGHAPGILEGWEARLRADRPSFTRYLITSILTAQPLDDATERWLWEIALRPSLYAGVQLLQMLSMIDLRDQMATLTVPTTVIHGSEDRLVPPSLGQAVASAIPGATYLPIEGAGHLLGLESRAIFEETLLGLLAYDAEQAHQKEIASWAYPGSEEDGILALETTGARDPLPDQEAVVAAEEVVPSTPSAEPTGVVDAVPPHVPPFPASD